LKIRIKRWSREWGRMGNQKKKKMKMKMNLKIKIEIRGGGRNKNEKIDRYS